jgi:hypothetical protein
MGIVHQEFVQQEQTVNHHFYTDVLWCLQEDVWQKYPEKWCTKDRFSHHDNASAFSALAQLLSFTHCTPKI